MMPVAEARSRTRTPKQGGPSPGAGLVLIDHRVQGLRGEVVKRSIVHALHHRWYEVPMVIRETDLMLRIVQGHQGVLERGRNAWLDVTQFPIVHATAGFGSNPSSASLSFERQSSAGCAVADWASEQAVRMLNMNRFIPRPQPFVSAQAKSELRPLVKQRATFCSGPISFQACASDSRMKRWTFSLNPSMWAQRPQRRAARSSMRYFRVDGMKHRPRPRPACHEGPDCPAARRMRRTHHVDVDDLAIIQQAELEVRCRWAACFWDCETARWRSAWSLREEQSVPACRRQTLWGPC